MQQISQVIRQMISISDYKLQQFLKDCILKNFKKKSILSQSFEIPNHIFFINHGLLRVVIDDQEGNEHTIHFALENQFIADYSAFIMEQPSSYRLQAIEDMQVVVIPRSTIEWGYEHLEEGEKLGRLIAEYYFIDQDNRIKNQYIRSAKERYDSISNIFPDIHNRAPQHMIASYLGITPIHLSRLKKEDYLKS